MTPREASELLRRVEARKRRRLQSPPPFTVFTLLYWIAVGCVSSAVIVFGALSALGLLEFRK